MQDVKQPIEDTLESKERLARLAKYEHPASDGLTAEDIAALPEFDQKAIKDARAKRARRAERNRKNLAKQKPSETK